MEWLENLGFLVHRVLDDVGHLIHEKGDEWIAKNSQKIRKELSPAFWHVADTGIDAEAFTEILISSFNEWLIDKPVVLEEIAFLLKFRNDECFCMELAEYLRDSDNESLRRLAELLSSS